MTFGGQLRALQQGAGKSLGQQSGSHTGPGYKKCVYKASEISRTIGMLTIVQREGGVLARQKMWMSESQQLTRLLAQLEKGSRRAKRREVCYW